MSRKQSTEETVLRAVRAHPEATAAEVAEAAVEFPVADPDHPGSLWTWASCLVEVPGDQARRDVEALHGGAPVLAAGQLSARWMIEGGHTSRRGVIVATLVKAGAPPDQPGLFVVGGGP